MGVKARLDLTLLGKAYLNLKFGNFIYLEKVWTGGPWKFRGNVIR